MTLTAAGRLTAALIGLSTFVFLFLHDSWRADNLFLVPDLVMVAALLGSAVLPDRYAGTALVGSLGFAAGVLATSVASYAVDGRIGMPSLVGVAVCVVMAGALLVRRPAVSAAPR